MVHIQELIEVFCFVSRKDIVVIVNQSVVYYPKIQHKICKSMELEVIHNITLTENVLQEESRTC